MPMTTTTSETVVHEWADAVTSGEALVAELGLSPCEGLHMVFPAVVGDDNAMGALASLLDPMIPAVASLEQSGVLEQGGAEMVLHDVFHLLQIAAGLGHMLGTADALAMADSIPDLDSIVWDDLPDFMGDEDTTATDTTPDQSGESEES
jgi:hypothetical protein